MNYYQNGALPLAGSRKDKPLSAGKGRKCEEHEVHIQDPHPGTQDRAAPGLSVISDRLPASAS